GLALLYPALERNVCVPGHHGYPRASDLILGKPLKGRSCHQITDATARPFLHLLIPARRQSAGKPTKLLESALAVPHRRSIAQFGGRWGQSGAAAIPLVNLSVFISRFCVRDACVIWP